MTMFKSLKTHRSVLRVFAVVTPSVFLFSAAPAVEFAGGNGTAGAPFLVATAEHLNAVRNHLGAHFRQTADIDLGVAPWNEGQGWTPIGNASTKFTGTYDGDGRIVSNLFINRSANYQGLFGVVEGSGARIGNLGVVDFSITGNERNGALVGELNYGAEVSGCHSSGTIQGTSRTGGLVGTCNYESQIEHSHSSATVTGGFRVGGLAGQAWDDCEIAHCHASGGVTATTSSSSPSSGGLVGLSRRSTIRDSHATGNVNSPNATGYYGTGGLVGFKTGWGGSILDSYAAGDVESTGIGVGGLVGWVEGGEHVIRGCHASGNVTGGNGDTGGLIGIFLFGENHLVEDCYATGDVTGAHNVGGLIGRMYVTQPVVRRSFATGNVTGSGDHVGGLVGEWAAAPKHYMTTSYIINCYALGNVSGNDHVGGLCGWFGGAGWVGDVNRIINSYAIGHVEGQGANVGALVGRMGEIVGGGMAYSYWNTETSGQTQAYPGSGGVYGSTTEQMTHPHDPTTYWQWDFDDAWAADVDGDVNGGYPYLRGVTPIPGPGPEPVGYDAWAASKIHDPEQRGEHDTPAGDRISNLLKYACGLDPMTVSLPADLMAIEGDDPAAGFSILFYRSKSAVDAEVHPQYRASLTEGEWSRDGVTEEKLGEEGNREQWKATAPAGGGSGFLRLLAVRLGN